MLSTASASALDSLATTSTPQELKCCARISRLLVLSSTISACNPTSLIRGRRVKVGDASTTGSSRTSNQNIEPRPTTLSTPICPPIKRGKFAADGQPQPGAAVFARGERVGLAEGVEYVAPELPPRCRCRCRSPRSAADHRSSRTLTRTMTSPASVNLMALPTRLIRIWRRRIGSLRTLAGHVELDVAGQLQALGMGARCADFDGLLDGFAQAELDAFKLELAGLDLGEIQDVVDDLQQVPRRNGRWFATSAAAAESDRLPAAVPTCP